jgi:hypothetical protein
VINPSTARAASALVIFASPEMASINSALFILYKFYWLIQCEYIIKSQYTRISRS